MKLHPKLTKPTTTGYYIVEYSRPTTAPGRYHYMHIRYNAEFDLWNSLARTESEANAERNDKRSIAGDDTAVITAYSYMPDRSLDNFYKELLYAGANHV